MSEEKIRIGTHGEDYGNWMSSPVFYMLGALLVISVVLMVMSFTLFRLTVLGMIFAIASVLLLIMLGWITWIRRQYAFNGGGMMGRVHGTLSTVHTGRTDMARVKSDRYRLLGSCLWIRAGHVREKRCQ